MKIKVIPTLTDNYNFAIIEQNNKATNNSLKTNCFVVDPSTYEDIKTFLALNKLNLSGILITHHHFDHIGGLDKLSKEYKCPVYGPSYDKHRIKNINHFVKEGDSINIFGSNFDIIYTPGHTLGHIIYHCKSLNILFSGDVIFAMGCGRVFEGSFEQAYNSLNKIKSLSSDTLIYCAHEYSLANAKFALSIEPDNQQSIDRNNKFVSLRKQNIPTIPILLKDELETNPFLRNDILSTDKLTPVKYFQHIRELKDNF